MPEEFKIKISVRGVTMEVEPPGGEECCCCGDMIYLKQFRLIVSLQIDDCAPFAQQTDIVVCQSCADIYKDKTAK